MAISKLTLEVQGQGSISHSGSNILSTHIHFFTCPLPTHAHTHTHTHTHHQPPPPPQFLQYNFFKFDLENPRSRSWAKVRGQRISPAFIRCISFLFHANRLNRSYDVINSIFYHILSLLSHLQIRCKPLISYFVIRYKYLTCFARFTPNTQLYQRQYSEVHHHMDVNTHAAAVCEMNHRMSRSTE